VNEIRHCTAIELLNSLQRWSVDEIVTDPPYGIGYESGEQRSNGYQDRRASASFGEDVFQDDWIAEAHRVLKPEGALYLFTRWDVLHLWKSALEGAGFQVVQRIVWDKMHWGMGNLDYYGSQTEDILFCIKQGGTHKMRWSKRQGNVWTMTKLDVINHEGNYDNPTQKPERLIRRAIELSSDAGMLVVDPFCGSGSTGAAARAIGRRYLMCDRDEYQYQIATERLAKPHAVSMFAAAG
jgi:DNA modification methylase